MLCDTKLILFGSYFIYESNSVDLYNVILPKINPKKLEALHFQMEGVTVNTESDKEILSNTDALGGFRTTTQN